LLVTDGVFSMDGDIAPVAALATLARQHGAWLVVDDAHGVGVIGKQGGGTLEAAGLDSAAVPVLIGTLGKALGSFGAFVAGDASLIDTLIQRARTYIYTTALPPAVAAATRAALRLVQREPWRRAHLATLIGRFRDRAVALGLPLAASTTPIQPLIVGDDARALALSEALLERGFWISAIRPPTVPQGSARLRVTLSAAHSESQLDALLTVLAEVFASRPEHVD
jgi:8-amino-7-oxononanoate synthase